MNVLFLTLGWITDINARGIYTDLLREFIHHGHRCYIVTPKERSTGEPTRVTDFPGGKILGVKTLNIQKTNIVEKGIGMLLLERQYLYAIRKYFTNVYFDLILYSTPPITFNQVIESEKKRCGARTYLLLKDIFPQNAVDLGMFSRKGLFYRFFRKKEQKLYQISDYIGCMSPANVQFVLRYNPGVDPRKVEVCPNCVKLEEMEKEVDREQVLGELGIPSEKTIFVYGGNLGKPQGVDFLMEILEVNERRSNSYFVVIGSGTEYPRLKRWFLDNDLQNSKLLSALPKEQYDNLVRVCDIGLIFLDRRFTIPNYPSRLLSYLESRVPVLLATDRNTDIGMIAVENGYGCWVESGDLEGFFSLVEKLVWNVNLREEMGQRGYQFLKENYTVEKGYEIIMNHFK